MKVLIKFRATFDAPDYYTFYEDSLVASYKGISEEIDISQLRSENITLDRIELEELKGLIDPELILRESEYDSSTDTLKLTLSQKSPKGFWAESHWIDAESYDKDTLYLTEGRLEIF